MTEIKKISLLAMIAMTILSFTSLFGIRIAEIAVFVGILFFFTNKRLEKQDSKGERVRCKRINPG